MTFLSTSQSLSDAIITAHLDPHTRFPICEDNDRNRVLGYVNFSGGTWMVGGGVPMEELAGKLGLTLPEAQGTISAWLIRRFGRVPQVNEIDQINGTEFMIRRTRRGKIFEVAVTHTARGSSNSEKRRDKIVRIQK